MARIALNARLLIPGMLEGTGRFTYQCYKRIVMQRPNDEFLLIFDRKPPSQFEFGPNCSSICLLPPARRPWLFDIWFDFAIAWKLKRWRADAFVSADGYLSRRSKIPQLNVIHDINFEHHPEWLPPRYAKHFRTRFPEYARRATKLCTVSEFSKQDISETYGLDSSSISVIPNAPDKSFAPISEKQKAHVRNSVSNGNKYHVFVGSIHPRKNIKGMIEAHKVYCSLGGKSDLVIVGSAMWSDEVIKAENVHWVGRLNDDDLVNTIAAANALLYLPFFEGFGVPIVEAMACGVPVIASNTTSIPEVCGGAEAALVSPSDSNSAAKELLKLENDEVWYNDRVRAGIKRAAEFSWEKSAKLLSMAIDEMLEVK
ncbi:MAG: glycosyltransferase [Bacteroidetes bacterium]|nr:MAG: glycosyltransferase [Bacteroidota bacterium]